MSRTGSLLLFQGFLLKNPEIFVIWGSAGHALVLADMLGSRGISIAALFDNNPLAESVVPGVDIYHGKTGFSQWLGLQNNREEIGAAIAIGGDKGRDRMELLRLFKRSGLQIPSLIHPTAFVSSSAQYGEGCHVLANAVVAAGAVVGNAVVINNSVNIDHECVLGDGVHIAPNATLCGCVKVSDHALVGAGAVVLPRIKIGEGAIIGAGSVVTKDIPECAVVAGNPAQIIKSAYQK